MNASQKKKKRVKSPVTVKGTVKEKMKKGVQTETWYLSRDTGEDARDNDTALQLFLVTWYRHINNISIISIKNEKLLNSNYKRSKPEYFRLLRDIVVFRLVAYLLNMICLKLKILYLLTQYQFLETETLDKSLLGIDQLLKCSGFSL